MRLKFPIRNKRQKSEDKKKRERGENSVIDVFNISFPFYTHQLKKKNDSGRD